LQNISWDQNGLPHSLKFDDKYFCRENGLAESQYIFCDGNHLKDRWTKLIPKDSHTFTIIETGFGSGLNFLCAWKLWEEAASPNWTLHYISIDQYPLSPEDLSKTLQLWPSLKLYTNQLIHQYNPLNYTNQQIYFNEKTVHLTLIFDHVLKALDKLKNQSIISSSADAWFLDGFAPSKNPEMWSEEMFACMADLSRLKTTLATFTVAGKVRRGLNQQGFTTTKTKGFGKKRQMLQGIFIEKKGDL